MDSNRKFVEFTPVPLPPQPLRKDTSSPLYLGDFPVEGELTSELGLGEDIQREKNAVAEKQPEGWKEPWQEPPTQGETPQDKDERQRRRLEESLVRAQQQMQLVQNAHEKQRAQMEESLRQSQSLLDEAQRDNARQRSRLEDSLAQTQERLHLTQQENDRRRRNWEEELVLVQHQLDSAKEERQALLQELKQRGVSHEEVLQQEAARLAEAEGFSETLRRQLAQSAQEIEDSKALLEKKEQELCLVRMENVRLSGAVNALNVSLSELRAQMAAQRQQSEAAHAAALQEQERKFITQHEALKAEKAESEAAYASALNQSETAYANALKESEALRIAEREEQAAAHAASVEAATAEAVALQEAWQQAKNESEAAHAQALLEKESQHAAQHMALQAQKDADDAAYEADLQRQQLLCAQLQDKLELLETECARQKEREDSLLREKAALETAQERQQEAFAAQASQVIAQATHQAQAIATQAQQYAGTLRMEAERAAQEQRSAASKEAEDIRARAQTDAKTVSAYVDTMRRRAQETLEYTEQTAANRITQLKNRLCALDEKILSANDSLQKATAYIATALRSTEEEWEAVHSAEKLTPPSIAPVPPSTFNQSPYATVPMSAMPFVAPAPEGGTAEAAHPQLHQMQQELYARRVTTVSTPSTSGVPQDFVQEVQESFSKEPSQAQNNESLEHAAEKLLPAQSQFEALTWKQPATAAFRSEVDPMKPLVWEEAEFRRDK